MASAIQSAPVQAEVRRLSEMLQQAGGAEQRRAPEWISSGCPGLDRLLPQGGWLRGSLVEWLGESPGGGAGTLALVAARQAHGDGGAVVVVDREGIFYPPAAVAWRLDLASTIVVHPESDKDEQWALDQALRCEHTAAVLAWPRRLDGRTFRRLQLAAESSGAIGLFVRPATAAREPSWADLRLAVAPRASPVSLPTSSGLLRALPSGLSRAPSREWQLCVRLMRCRARFGKKEGEVVLEIDPQTGDIHEARPRPLAAELAGATAAHQQA
jgi:protein ImuA